MKRLLPLILFTVCLSFNLFSQISVVETKKEETENIGKIGAIDETWIEVTKDSNTYTFYYKDMKFEKSNEYKSFSFEDIDNAFDSLYNMMLEGIKNKLNEDVMIELPNDIIWLHFDRSMGQSYVEFRHAVNKDTDVIGVSTWMNQKKLMKVFGK